MEAAIIGSGFDDRIRHTSDLGSNRGIRFAPEIGIGRIPPDVSFKFLTKCVLARSNSNRTMKLAPALMAAVNSKMLRSILRVGTK